MTSTQYRIKHTPETDAWRYVYTAERIDTYFYQKNDYLVLDNNFVSLPKSVFFPKMELCINPDFWKLAYDMWEKDPEANPLFESIKISLEKYALSEKEVKKEKKLFEKEFPKFAEEFSRIFPKITVPYERITVIPTNIGTICSRFVIYGKNNPEEITFYWRYGSPISELFGMYILSLLTDAAEYRNLLWNERMLLKDFIMTKSSLSIFLKEYAPQGISNPREIDKKFIKQSNAYFTELGFPKEKVFNIEDNRITCLKKDIRLTKNEYAFLYKLLERSGSIVLFDELAESVWPEDSYSKFSINALAKIAERIRKKIRKLGVHAEIIETVWGRGYLVND